MNALAGYRRSIVAPTAGTTRDAVTLVVALDGWPVELCDTAGLRESADAVERQGVALAEAAIRNADLCVWLADAAGPHPGSVEAFAAAHGVGVERVLPAANKIDLPAAWDSGGWLAVSALTGRGLAELQRAIVSRLVPEAPPPGAAVPLV